MIILHLPGRTPPVPLKDQPLELALKHLPDRRTVHAYRQCELQLDPGLQAGQKARMDPAQCK